MDKELRLDEHHQYFKARKLRRRIENARHRIRDKYESGLRVSYGRRMKEYDVRFTRQT